MPKQKQQTASVPEINLPAEITALVLMFIVTAMTIAAPAAEAQTLTVLHSFTGGSDGGSPAAGLTVDAAGNFYGTTPDGGAGYGTVFKLSPSRSGWLLSPLYSFAGPPDGATPVARVVFGPDHTLYGTTEYGGYRGSCGPGCGTVFKLAPPPAACKTAVCPWDETILRRFSTGGVFPESEVTFDSQGNLYGTTNQSAGARDGGGGCEPCGDVYELLPSNGGWTEEDIYEFSGFTLGDTGGYPIGGVIFGRDGNLYGTTSAYGCEYGTLFQLTYSGSTWTETTLHSFCGGNDGASPVSSLIMDEAGNMYGATIGAYAGYGGVRGSAFMLTPSNGGWDYSLIYTFPEYGGGPAASLVMDTAGNLYGTTVTGGHLGCGSYGCGTIFKLSPASGDWTYTELYDFTGGDDGGAPYSNLIIDAAGNLYGTASIGGQSGKGVVFEFTP
jgi:uncharacterized repeat protein (TIGR03803 family)